MNIFVKAVNDRQSRVLLGPIWHATMTSEDHVDSNKSTGRCHMFDTGNLDCICKLTRKSVFSRQDDALCFWRLSLVWSALKEPFMVQRLSSTSFPAAFAPQRADVNGRSLQIWIRKSASHAHDALIGIVRPRRGFKGHRSDGLSMKRPSELACNVRIAA